MLTLHQEILRNTEASQIIRSASVQTLWSGYGEIQRVYLKGGKYPSVIVKHICWPDETNHPKGWNTAISHQRKLKSYQVEKNWYQHFAMRTNQHCRVPQIIHSFRNGIRNRFDHGGLGCHWFGDQAQSPICDDGRC